MSEMEQLIEEWTPELVAAFLAAVAELLSRVRLREVERQIAAGDPEGAAEALHLEPAFLRPLVREIENAYEAGGEAAAARVPPGTDGRGLRLEVRFEARNLRAEQWLRAHSTTMAQQVTDDQRAMVRQSLEGALARGDNPKTAALDLVGRLDPRTGRRTGGLVGLTASQEAWVRNYEAELLRGDRAALGRRLRDRRYDRALERAAATGEPLPAATLRKAVAAYRARALRYRAESLARTEAMAALHVSQDEAFRQAVEAGQVRRENVRKVWRSAGDRRVRHTHRALNGTSVGVNDRFLSPSGARLRFPADPEAPPAEIVNCRCSCQYRVDHLANIS